jgi:hypothetical protein
MLGFARTLIVICGLALLALGVWLAIAEALPVIGLLTGAIGIGLVLAIAVERMRYRGLLADRRADTVGGAGGEEVGVLEPRFVRTDEVFVDPTTDRRLRVFIDPSNGERRYILEA